MDKLIRGEIVNVYEVRVERQAHQPGPDHYTAGYYISENEATESVKSINNSYMLTHKALMAEEKGNGEWVWYLLTPIGVNTETDDEAIITAALSKLTKEEKEALGLIEHLEDNLVIRF